MVPAKVLPLKRYTNAWQQVIPPEDGSENAKTVHENVTTAVEMAAPRPALGGSELQSTGSSLDSWNKWMCVKTYLTGVQLAFLEEAWPDLIIGGRSLTCRRRGIIFDLQLYCTCIFSRLLLWENTYFRHLKQVRLLLNVRLFVWQCLEADF